MACETIAQCGLTIDLPCDDTNCKTPASTCAGCIQRHDCAELEAGQCSTFCFDYPIGGANLK